MVNRKLDGAGEKSSVDRKICKSDVTVHKLWNILSGVLVSMIPHLAIPSQMEWLFRVIKIA